MTELLRVTVPGIPRPQGSMKLFRAKSGHEVAKYSDRTIEWRHLVTAAVQSATNGQRPVDVAVVLHVVFRLPRPRGHFGSGRNAETLRPSAPRWPTTMPDLDKLARAINDAITDAQNVWLDDAQVVEIRVRKVYADEVPAGALIVVFPAEKGNITHA